jgi:FHS family glucose/mannose:H+ symporter-like MFS transporter
MPVFSPQVSSQQGSIDRATRRPIFIAHATFVPTGIVTVLLGPLLPILATRWSLNDAQAGSLVTAQFLGALLSTLSTGGFLPHWGFRRTLAIGLFLMAAGVATLSVGPFAVGLAAVFCYGMGIGLTIPSTNLMVAQASPENRSSALNLLNFSWSAGAVACPFLLAAFQQLGSNFFLYLVCGILLAVVGLAIALPSNLSESGRKQTAGMKLSWLQSLSAPLAIVVGALFFTYVGTESALGAWLAYFAKRASYAPGFSWMTVPSYFYSALLLGRALAPLSLRLISDRTQALLGAALSLASTGALFLSHSVPVIGVCAFLAGFGLSTLYPIAIGFLSRFGESASRVGGFMFALSSVGGATLPWILGIASTQLGSLRIALVVPLAGCLAMLLLFSNSRLQEAKAI